MTRMLLSVFLLLPLPVSAEVCAQGPLAGKVTYVYTGDRIELNGFLPIDLRGLAAPNWDEPGAAQARNALRDMLLEKWVECELDGFQIHNRCVAICRLHGTDVAEALLRQGLARDCPRYSGGRYQATERAAAQRGATIAETFKLPGYCLEMQPQSPDLASVGVSR